MILATTMILFSISKAEPLSIIKKDFFHGCSDVLYASVDLRQYPPEVAMRIEYGIYKRCEFLYNSHKAEDKKNFKKQKIGNDRKLNI